VHRFNAFHLFFEEDYVFSNADEKLVQKLVFKILHDLVDKQFICKQLTYEYVKDIKSINLYKFEAILSLKFNLFDLKISLVKPGVFINKKTPYSRGLTYLSVNRIMLMNSANLKEFQLKDLNLLYQLFSTQYVFDTYYYQQIYNEVFAITPTQFIDEAFNLNHNLKNMDLNPYWYNFIFLEMRDVTS
jgi:hypothetical protein